MRGDLQPGGEFPDFSLPDTEGKPLQLGRYMDGWPTVVTFNRGNYCPKDRRQLINYAVHLQPELLVNYCKLLTVTVEARLESIEMKTGVGAFWPFLSDHDRKLLRELDLADESDPRYSPVYIPHVFVLHGERRIHKVYNGWWYVGRPTVDELRFDLRAVMSQRPDWAYSKDWNDKRGQSVRPDPVRK